MQNKVITVGVIAAIIIGLGVMFFGSDDDNLATEEQSYTVTNTTNKNTDGAISNTAKSGTYTASIDYKVPAPEQNSMTVSMTLENGFVAKVEVENTASHHESQQYISRFMSRYESQVVGKKLSDISLSRVGGASLTTNAFNAAVKSIATQAV